MVQTIPDGGKLAAAPEGYTSPVNTGELNAARTAAYDADTARYTASVADWELHPAVIEALTIAHPACGLVELVYQWPHESGEAPGMLAYTQSAEKASRNLQTRTKLGRYLARHWPMIRDEVLRDIASRHVAANTFEFAILDDADDIVDSAMYGPKSCMRTVDHDASYHPYRCYDPRLGWSVAVRCITKDDTKHIVGRALLHTTPECTPPTVYVRSFKAVNDNTEGIGYSESDEKLEAWLHGKGITRAKGWREGTRLAVVHGPYDQQVAPYIDGNVDRTDNDHNTLIIRDDNGAVVGALEYFTLSNSCGTCLNNADGWMEDEDEDEDNTFSCGHCGDTTDVDGVCTVLNQRGAFMSVCPHCYSEEYTECVNTAYPVRCGQAANILGGDSLCVASWADTSGYTELDCGRHCGNWADTDDVICDVDANSWHISDAESGDVVLCTDDKYRAKSDADEFEEKQERTDAEEQIPRD